MKTFWEYLAEIAQGTIPYQPAAQRRPLGQQLQQGQPVSPAETQAMEKIRQATLPTLGEILRLLQGQDAESALTVTQRLPIEILNKLPRPGLTYYQTFTQLMDKIATSYKDINRKPAVVPFEVGLAVTALRHLIQSIQPPQQQAG